MYRFVVVLFCLGWMISCGEEAEVNQKKLNAEDIDQSNLKSDDIKQKEIKKITIVNPYNKKLDKYTGLIELRDTSGVIIKIIDSKKLNPYLKNYKLTSEEQYASLYEIGEDGYKEKLKKVFNDDMYETIPDDFAFNMANIWEMPWYYTNGTNMFVTSYFFEWGPGLLAELSVGEYFATKTYFWNLKGELIKTSNKLGYLYPTPNGLYYWRHYTKPINLRTMFDASCIALYNMKTDEELYNICFDKDDGLIVKGSYLNKWFLFGINKEGNKIYQFYCFNDEKLVLYTKSYKNGQQSNWTGKEEGMEDIFHKINIKKLQL